MHYRVEHCIWLPFGTTWLDLSPHSAFLLVAVVFLQDVNFTTDVRQPWTNPQDCYFEYLIIRFDYLIIRFDYLITG